ncbi:hypothetical protein DL771_008548 [Monosporascus sp. 5C6A]|nr:hypothetical protein DL771_008548 [Monosporascus sp. 5C6A]
MFMYGLWTMRSVRDYGIPLLQPLNAHRLEYLGVKANPATMDFGMDTGIEVTPEAAAITKERHKKDADQARERYAARKAAGIKPTEAQLKRKAELQRARRAAKKVAEVTK